MICTIIFVRFFFDTANIKLFVKIATIVIPEKKEVIETNYLDERLLKNSSIALDLAIKETIYLGSLSMDVLNKSIDDFLKVTTDNADEIRKEITKIEKINQAILDYLLQISSNDDSQVNEQVVSSLHRILIDFGREVEIADNMLKYADSRLQNDLVFSKHVDDGVNEIRDRLNQQFAIVKGLFTKNSAMTIEDSDRIEEEIDNLRNTLVDGHIRRLEEGKCSPRSNTVFISLVSNLERAGDHLNYVAHALVEGGENLGTTSYEQEGVKIK